MRRSRIEDNPTELEAVEDEDTWTLFQWPGTVHCDSLYVRCTKLQRVLGLLKVDYKLKNISFPQGMDKAKIEKRIAPLMRKIPILQVGNKMIQDTNEIFNYIVKENEFEGFIIKDSVKYANSYFIKHFVEHWMVWLVVYARFVQETNYKRFIKTLLDVNNTDFIMHSINYTRDRAIMFLKNTEVGNFDHTAYLEAYACSLAVLDRMLDSQDYLIDDTIQECDLSVFMCMQAFYDPAFIEESTIARGYKNLTAWFLRVEAETLNDNTRRPSFK